MTWKYMVWSGITVSMLIILLVKFKEIKKKNKKKIRFANYNYFHAIQITVYQLFPQNSAKVARLTFKVIIPKQ